MRQTGYRRVAEFRQENWPVLKAVNRDFVLLPRRLDLVGGELAATDGAFFLRNSLPRWTGNPAALRERRSNLDRLQ
jgi:hypothetical protein